MRWNDEVIPVHCIEQLTIRSRSEIDRGELKELLLWVMREHGTDELTAIHVYRNGFLETDVSIHIHWHRSSSTSENTMIGHMLWRELRRYGLVDHTIWFEEELGMEKV